MISKRELTKLAVAIGLGLAVTVGLKLAQPVGQNIGEISAAQEILQDRLAPRLESPGADVTMIVFTDYQCPACKLADRGMKAAVRADGRVRIVFRDWPIFGARSERSARVALATSPQGIYPVVHSRLMAERRRLDDAVVREDVEAVGGNWSKIQLELQRQAPEIARQLASNSADAFRLGLDGTPSYLIGPILVRGGMDERGFRRAFAAARAAQRKAI